MDLEITRRTNKNGRLLHRPLIVNKVLKLIKLFFWQELKTELP